MTYEYIFLMFVRSLAMSEYKSDGYTIIARDFRILYCFNPPLQLTENTSNYLIKCCYHVNHFYQGSFELSLKNIKDIECFSDDIKIGNHWIYDKIGDVKKLEKLIEEGNFKFDGSELWP